MPKIGQRKDPTESLRALDSSELGERFIDCQYGETPTVRLVAPNVVGAHLQGNRVLCEPPPPTIRLATGVGPPDAFAKGLAAPVVRLAGKYHPGNHSPQGISMTDIREQGQKEDLTRVDPLDLPALLVSYYYLEPFLENRHRYYYRNWVMDSGAFSAHNSGVTIDLRAYIDCCKKLQAEDPTLVEVYALDVIGDWKSSIKNTEEMWKQGVQAIPCFHANEPWNVLIGLCKDYPKVALGGIALAKAKRKMEWAGQCFARVWPKKLHGFGFGSETAVLSFPWHSTDATNWEIGPVKYGQWRAFGGQRVSVRGSKQNLRSEVEWYLELERRARERWKKEMAKLEELSLS